jgi:hypothetical protein
LGSGGSGKAESTQLNREIDWEIEEIKSLPPKFQFDARRLIMMVSEKFVFPMKTQVQRT